MTIMRLLGAGLGFVASGLGSHYEGPRASGKGLGLRVFSLGFRV